MARPHLIDPIERPMQYSTDYVGRLSWFEFDTLDMLERINDGTGCTSDEIGMALRIKRANIQRYMWRMAQTGMINIKDIDPEAAISSTLKKYYSVTDKGKSLLKQAYDTLDAWIEVIGVEEDEWAIA